MPTKIRLLFFVGLLLPLKLFAGPLPVKHFTTENGLLSNTTFSLFFDSKGYMWIASDKGLERYNGKEFKKFTINDGLPDNEVFGLGEDAEGRIWISTFKGVLCYYKDNVFHTATNTPWLKLKAIKVPSFSNQFFLQKDSSVLTTSFDGCFMLEIKKERLKIIPINSLWSGGISNYPATHVIKLSQDRYKVFYNHQSYIIDSSGSILKKNVYSDTTLFIACISSNKRYLASKKGIYNLDMQLIVPRKLEIINTNSSIVGSIIDKDHFFLGMHNGLLYNKDQVLLKGNRITTIDHDNLGNIWVSTLENGIFCLSKDFERIYTKPVPDKIIASMCRDSVFYFVTENGNLYNTSHPTPIAFLSLHVRDNNGKLFTKSTFCLSENGDMLWGHNYEFYYKSKVSPKFKRIFIKSSTNIGYPVKSINYFNNKFYIAYRASLLIIPVNEFKSQDTLDANKFIVYRTNNMDRIYCAALNKADSSFWFSKLNETYSTKNGVIVEHPELNNYTFRQFHFYKNYLVGSTDDNKLFIYNSQSKVLDNIPNTSCVWENIYPIDNYTAIINTDNYYKMLTLFPPDKRGKPKYKLENIGNMFLPSQADYVFGNKKRYYFQRDGMLTGISSNGLLKGTVLPKPLFVSLKTGETSYPIKSVLNITYEEAKTICIQIDAIDYSNLDLITQYSISKNGNENKWNTITGNEINLNEAAYGKYVVKLRCKTVSGTFSTPISLSLTIEPPFWAKWWFLLFCSIAFLALAYISIQLIARLQIRKKQRIHDAEMKLQEAEYKALNALMNPHFIFNSLNNIQSLVNRNFVETANQYLVIFSKLIRQNMLNISKGLVSLSKELELVENYLNLEKLRYKEIINYSIEVDEEIDIGAIMISPLLIQPLVENAIIHGLLPKQSLDNKISIIISELDNILLIEIIDNGVGITKSFMNRNRERESYGLINLKRRIDHLKKTQKREIVFNIDGIIDAEGNVSGTRASISIKL